MRHEGKPVICNCTHVPSRHDGDGDGPCTGLDSYGLPCACPSYEEMDDGDEEEGDS